MALVAMKVSHINSLTCIDFIIYSASRLRIADFADKDEAPRYERDRSASPRPQRRNESPRGSRRSPSPGGSGHMDARSVSTPSIVLLTFADASQRTQE